MPATLFDVCSFQNMTTKLSRWHKSPVILKMFMNIATCVLCQYRGGCWRQLAACSVHSGGGVASAEGGQ